MVEVAPRFDDSAAYDRFMGRWSNAAGLVFIDWLSPPANAQWLDVGCGTGAFTQIVIDRCIPTEVFAIDPEPAQVDYAMRRPAAAKVNFQVGDARSLPFPSNSFDVVVSALVLNFIPDRRAALAEMRRVARAGGVVAAYIWDFANELSPSGPLRSGLRHFGLELPGMPGASQSSLHALHSMFEQAGLEKIVTKAFDVTVPYSGFDDFWHAQTSSHSPTTNMVATLSAADRERLAKIMRADLPNSSDRSIRYVARANAIKAHVPA